jgi:hypothetical protein
MNGNAKAWVAALRSGEFKQTCGTLRDVLGYCPLGVACALATRAGVVQEKMSNGKIEYDDHSALLPFSVRDWLGLSSAAGDYLGERGRTSLASKNDTDGFNPGK